MKPIKRSFCSLSRSAKGSFPLAGGLLFAVCLVVLLVFTVRCLPDPWVTPTPAPTPTPPPTIEAALTIPYPSTAATGRDSEGNLLTPTPGQRISFLSTPQGQLNLVLPVPLAKDKTLTSFSDPINGIILSGSNLIIPIRNAAGKVQMTLSAAVETLRGTGSTAEGRVERLELETATLAADLSAADSRVGQVSFQTRTELKSLPEGAGIDISVAKSPNPAAANAFTLAATRLQNRLKEIAFVVNVGKAKLVDGKDIGPGTVAISISREWASAFGAGNIAVAQLSDDDSVEILRTVFGGYPDEGGARFTAQTRLGLSVFALVALETAAPTPTPTPIFYSVTILVDNPDSGTVKADPPSPTGRYLEGTNVTLIAGPNPGCKFDRWEYDLSGTLSRLDFVVDSDKSIMAVFSKQSFTVNADAIPRAGGTVEVSPNFNSHEYGSRVTFYAEPGPGYFFKSWSGDASGSENPVTITIDGPKNIIANFVTIQYSLGTLVNPPGAGSVSPISGTYDTGTRVTLAASPNPGYSFYSWSGDSPSQDNPLTIKMDRNKNILANFVRARYSLTVMISPARAGAVSPSSGVYDYGSTVTLTAMPNAEFFFAGWSGDISGSENPKTITMTKDMSIVASFVGVRYTLNVNISPPGGGWMSPATFGTYPSGTVVTVSAYPAAGYQFTAWTGDFASPSPTITIQVNRNMSMTANFRLVPTSTPTQ